MSIKLNKYTLPDETIDLMKLAERKTKKINRELGFALCADKKDNLQARNACAGEACKIRIEKKCGEQETYTGSYHTHPYGDSIGNAGDLDHCGIDKYTCIGGDNTRCYIWQHWPITTKKYNELIELYNKGIEQINDPIYEKNFDCIKKMKAIFDKQNAIRQINKKIVKQEQELQMTKQEKDPKYTIDKIKKDLKSNTHNETNMWLEWRQKIAELTPEYYEDKILW